MERKQKTKGKEGTAWNCSGQSTEKLDHTCMRYCFVWLQKRQHVMLEVRLAKGSKLKEASFEEGYEGGMKLTERGSLFQL